MVEIRETDHFSKWMLHLGDARAKARIAARIQRLSFGNAGDVRSVGDGISEMRIDYGPGYRVYYIKRGLSIVLLLCGGTKKGQAKDIELAKALVDQLR